MSDEDEYDDELPPVYARGAAEAAPLVMPSAGELAAARARERCLEARVRALDTLQPAPSPLERSDSSDSGGESALTRAVTALAVCSSPTAAPPPRIALLAALAPLLPPPLAALCVTPRGGSVRAVAAALGPAAPAAADAGPVAAWFCACAAHGGDDAGLARRALHRLLDARGERAVEATSALLVRAVAALGDDDEERSFVLREMADCARSGADGGADSLAARLADAALQLVVVQDGSVSARRRYAALAAGARCGRALGGAEVIGPGAVGRAVPDAAQLRAAVYATRLQLLLRNPEHDEGLRNHNLPQSPATHSDYNNLGTI